jgi:endonuclease/exonuclease/phosphatase family metal-dependent hydrolase
VDFLLPPCSPRDWLRTSMTMNFSRNVLTVLALSSALAASACAPDDGWEGPVAEAELAATTRLRVMAGNLTSGTAQSYDPGHGIHIFKGAHPDVALVQELNYGSNSTTDIRAFVDAAFGTEYSYYREGGAQIPNAIVSRYPILESGEWDDTSVSNRDFAWARIDIPGPVDLWAVSVHLLTSNASIRNTEAQKLVSYIKGKVPAGDYLVIGGDFNTGSRSEACISTLAQVTVAQSPYPVDHKGNGNTNASRSSPYDWVLADGDLHKLETSVVIGGSTYANGLVVDTRVYTPLAELSPAVSGDSGAAYMQHMGVVRDFMVPTDDGGQVPPDDGGSNPPPAGGSVFLNEILANEPGSNGAAEFVEIVNGSASSVDLSGYTLSDGVGARHTFAAGTTLAAGKGLVVFGGSTAIQAGISGVAASSGALGLGNSGDTVTLKSAGGVTVDTLTYPSSLSATDGVSMNRNPDADAAGSFVLHTSVGSSSSSPGTHAAGTSF